MEVQASSGWINTYNSNHQENKSDSYPMGGYQMIKNVVDDFKIECGVTKVLDLGIGTGQMISTLYQKGAVIYGVDINPEMIDICQDKFPGSYLEIHDICNGLPANFEGIEFDYIISTYVFRNFERAIKSKIMIEGTKRLTQNGVFLIGEVSFIRFYDLLFFKSFHEKEWRNKEIYMIADKTKDTLVKENIPFSYRQVNDFTGIYLLEKARENAYIDS